MVDGSRGVPDRGDLAWVTFGPQADHEQAGRRPGVFLSLRTYNGLVGLAIVCPVTQQVKGYEFEVPLPRGLPVSGVILADHVRSLDWRARQAEFIARLPAATLHEVVQKLARLLPEATG